jgi:hypothetical protein
MQVNITKRIDTPEGRRFCPANRTQEYVYRVEHVVLFGSMLSDVDRLGDVDVAVLLQPKVNEEAAFQEWSMARRRSAEAKGRNFYGYARQCKTRPQCAA